MPLDLQTTLCVNSCVPRLSVVSPMTRPASAPLVDPHYHHHLVPPAARRRSNPDAVDKDNSSKSVRNKSLNASHDARSESCSRAQATESAAVTTTLPDAPASAPPAAPTTASMNAPTIASTVITSPTPEMASRTLQSLPRLTTNLVPETRAPVPASKKLQSQRIASDDEGLQMLPSPATSVADFPATHHARSAHAHWGVSPPLDRQLSHSKLHHSAQPSPLRNGSCRVVNNSEDEMSPSLNDCLIRFGLPVTTQVIDRYAIIKDDLGEGSFSQVKLAVDLRSGDKVAIKMTATQGIQDSERLQSSVQREIQLLKFINHPNVVRLIDTIDTPTHLCLVMEYVPGGELFDYVINHYRETTEQDTKRLFLQLVNVVAYLHNNNIVHRDLKLENVLLTGPPSPESPPSIKLTDFGLARFIDPQQPLLTTRCGSEEYAAPEIVTAKPYDGRRTDIWALGIILYALLVSQLPFDPDSCQTKRQFFSKIAHADFDFPRQRDTDGEVDGSLRRTGAISEGARDLIRKILQSDPNKRATLDEIRSHPWLAGTVARQIHGEH